MPQSRRTIVVKHCAAMQLILSMQDAGTGEYINVTYVRANPTAPTSAPERVDDLQRGLEALQDLLMLVDPDVYAAYHQILNRGFGVPGVNLTPALAESSVDGFSSTIRAVTELTRLPMWCSGGLHPSTFIMREVVAELLA